MQFFCMKTLRELLEETECSIHMPRHAKLLRCYNFTSKIYCSRYSPPAGRSAWGRVGCTSSPLPPAAITLTSSLYSACLTTSAFAAPTHTTSTTRYRYYHLRNSCVSSSLNYHIQNEDNTYII